METYYDNSSRWVFDSDGNYLHSKRSNHNPHIERDGYFFSNTERDIYIKEDNLDKKETRKEKL